MGKKKLIFLIPAVVLVLFAIIYIVVSGNFFNRGESAEKADSSEMIIEEVNAKSSKASENIKKETAEIRMPPQCTVCPKRPLCHVCAAVCITETGYFDRVPEYVCAQTDEIICEAWKIYQEREKTDEN